MANVTTGLKWLLVAVTCPCHVPVWIALLGGTAAGAWLASNMLLAIVLSTGLFIASFVWAGRGLSDFSSGDKPGTIVWTAHGEEHGVEQEPLTISDQLVSNALNGAIVADSADCPDCQPRHCKPGMATETRNTRYARYVAGDANHGAKNSASNGFALQMLETAEETTERSSI